MICVYDVCVCVCMMCDVCMMYDMCVMLCVCVCKTYGCVCAFEWSEVELGHWSFYIYLFGVSCLLLHMPG